jgi:hypothetical protein
MATQEEIDSFGRDVYLVDDLAPVWGVAEGKLNLAAAIARRLGTPLGGLFYDPEYGFDLRLLLNAGLTPADESAALGAIIAQCEKDPRVESADVTFDLTLATGGLDIIVELETAEGPFNLILRATQVTVELLTVDGVVAPPPIILGETVAVVGPTGAKGDQGPAGPPGVGTGIFETPLDEATEYYSSSGAEEVLAQFVVDFDALPSGSLSVRLSALLQSDSGTATYRVRVGGTDFGVNGTVVTTVTVGAGSFAMAGGINTITNPSGRQIVKLSAQSSGAGLAARIKDLVITIR